MADAVEAVRQSAAQMERPAHTQLVDRAGEADFVLIGEASHGTEEFYQVRAEITRQLIQRKGFHAVAAEADWPDAHRVNQYVRGRGRDGGPKEALSGFARFPIWMWRNTVMRDFCIWLRERNRTDAPQAGFYGLDLYSLTRSRAEVVRYLDRVDPEAARRARHRYGCFDHFGEDEQEYGYSAGFGMSGSCEKEVIQQLVELQRRAFDYANRDGHIAQDDFFSAEQNARVVRNAEEYYRLMFRGRVNTWNLRDRHMAETMHALAAHFDQRFGRSKLVVWAHNSHVGDARATEMSRRGEWNLGQLARERYPGNVFIIGFTTYSGTVTAADNWGDEPETKKVRPGLPGSYEEMFHQTRLPQFWLDLRKAPAAEALREPKLERAIGVIYRPETERASHYFDCRIADQFDAVIHIDTTTALQPLEWTTPSHPEEVPETFPSGV
jgi:erythromycin esterase-like protein